MQRGDIVRIKKNRFDSWKKKVEGTIDIEKVKKYEGYGIVTNIETGDKRDPFDFYKVTVHFSTGVEDLRWPIHNFCSGKPKKGYNVLRKICRQCNKPFNTTSSIEVVHAECRGEYYRGLNRRQYEKRETPCRIKKARSYWFIKKEPCSCCGLILLTKKKRYFNEGTRAMEYFYLCPLCISLVRCGFKEPITWKDLDTAEITPAHLNNIVSITEQPANSS